MLTNNPHSFLRRMESLLEIQLRSQREVREGKEINPPKDDLSSRDNPLLNPAHKAKAMIPFPALKSFLAIPSRDPR